MRDKYHYARYAEFLERVRGSSVCARRYRMVANWWGFSLLGRIATYPLLVLCNLSFERRVRFRFTR